MPRTQRTEIRETIHVRQIPGSADDYQGDYRANVPVLDVAWSDGTGDAEADVFYSNYGVSIAGGGSLSLDLASLSGGPDGAAVVFADVRAILVRARAANADTVTLAPHMTNGWTALGSNFELELQPGAYLRLYHDQDGGWPVSAMDKVLEITNDHAMTAAVVDIVIIGAGS